MTIQINDKQKVVPTGATISDVLFKVLEINAAGVAVAINDSIVPRHLWESSTLQSNDRMLVIKAAAGG